MKDRPFGHALAVSALAGASTCFAQVSTQAAAAPNVVPAPQIAPAVAADDAAGPTIPPLPPADDSGIKPTNLPAVHRTLDTPEAWQKATEQVLEKVEVPELRAQLTEGLNNLAPRLAKGLMDHRGDTGYVTVATYREPGEGGKQAAVALAFEGFGERLDATFYARVLSDMPRASDNPSNPAPKGLVLDPRATYYLCYFLSRSGLSAGAIPHEQMKQEVASAFDQKGTPQPTVSGEAGQPGAIQPATVNAPPDEPAAGTINIGPSYPASVDSGSAYGPGYPSYYYGDWGLYGLGWYNPVIIDEGHRHHDWSHWQRWNWNGYHGVKGPDAVGSTNRTPGRNSAGATGTGSNVAGGGSTQTATGPRTVAGPAVSEQPPVFRPSVREPVGPGEVSGGRATPGSASRAPSGAAPTPAPARTGGSTAGGGGGEAHSSGGAGGASHTGGTAGGSSSGAGASGGHR